MKTFFDIRLTVRRPMTDEEYKAYAALAKRTADDLYAGAALIDAQKTENPYTLSPRDSTLEVTLKE